MFLVIFGHLGVENHFASNLVSSFHMPAFFMLSGIFASVKGTWAEALKRDFMRLLLPVILWHLIGVFSWTPVQTWVLHKADFWPSLLQQQVDFVLGESWDFGWFMIALFWIKIWYRLINKLPQYGQVIIGLVIFPTIAYALHSYGHMPFFIQSSLMAFPFYFVGHLAKEAILREDFVLLNKFTPPIWFLTLVGLFCLNGSGNIPRAEYGDNALIYYLQGLVGAAFAISLCKNLPAAYGKVEGMLNVLGNGTIVLLLFQPPCIMIGKIAYRILFHPAHQAPYFSIVGAAVTALLILLAMYPCIRWINSHVPVLNGRASKS